MTFQIQAFRVSNSGYNWLGLLPPRQSTRNNNNTSVHEKAAGTLNLRKCVNQWEACVDDKDPEKGINWCKKNKSQFSKKKINHTSSIHLILIFKLFGKNIIMAPQATPSKNQAEVVLVGCGAPLRGMGWYHAVQMLNDEVPHAKLCYVVEPWFLGAGE